MKTTDLRERIATRAYFAWLNGSTAGHEADWIDAELIELVGDLARQAVVTAAEQTDRAVSERRSAAAKKAAATRKAKAATKAPVAVVAARKPAARASVH